MRYTIERHPLSWRNPLVFLNEAGEAAYRVSAASFTLRSSNVSITNAANVQVGCVHTLFWRVRPGFEVYRGDDRVALIEMEQGVRTWFRAEVSDGGGFAIRPNVWWTQFDFVGHEGRNAVLTAPFFKHPFSSSSELTIFDERQEIMVIAASVVVLKKAYET